MGKYVLNLRLNCSCNCVAFSWNLFPDLSLSLSRVRSFQKFYRLQDHLKERINTPMYSVLKSNLITFFKTILSLEEFDELTILKTAAILDTNAFEIRSANGRSKLRAIYAETAMMSHDCVPNSYHSFDANMQIAIRAASKLLSMARLT